MKQAMLTMLLVTACTGLYRSAPGADGGGSGSGSGTDASGNKIVFVTKNVYQGGKLGGLTGADSLCAAEATAAHVSGSFRAWLATDTESPATRLTRSIGNYQLVNGKLVAQGWDNLVSGLLQNAVDTGPDGSTVAGVPLGVYAGPEAWTNVAFDGTESELQQSCSGWADLGSFGAVGDCQITSANWTDNGGGEECTGQANLYCVEQ
jgi:hypothetical protein